MASSLPLPPPSTCHDSDNDTDSDTAEDETKRIIQDFLNALDFQSPRTPRNTELRRKLQTEIEAWDLDVSTTFTDKMLSNSCNMAECTYPFCSFDIQYFIALYTAFTFYADDHCEDDPEPIGQFAFRFSTGQKQLDPVLDRFAAHLKNAFDLFPLAGANVIVSGTFDSMNGMYLEYTTKDMTIRPQAIRYPTYLRSRAGVGVPYAQFSFSKAWRDRVNSYLQIIPEMDYFIVGTNDILSFYKESLAGETDNYVHLRAAAEEKSPIQVLHELSNEVLDTVRRITNVVSPDPELADIWRQFIHGYLEFHVKTPRYRLRELNFHP
ncbi:hypothetical protein FRC04_005461 [Tulasnella sp. 424]|nr:hypothetical protein FRC04_005461 [Tulasnella sp. 424]KAG8963882.1 hypothetical protein FRC05_004377 [Tulasnella sp. 425]